MSIFREWGFTVSRDSDKRRFEDNLSDDSAPVRSQVTGDGANAMKF